MAARQRRRGGGRAAVCVSLLLVSVGFAQRDAASEPSVSITARVRLLAPLTTKFNRKGDLVSARVLLPANYQGSILEGEVREVRTGGLSGKSSYVEFDFHALHVSDQVLPVRASVVESLNSRGQSELDEEGSALETTGRGVAGKLIADFFTRNAAPPLRLSAKSPNLSFLPGSEFVLQLQFRKGH